ncbi:hypothetical protein [Loigolactobacillus backii]|uniref:Uncharacterized protein n=1 Tax=Loigolactobacillus backii TaxID=375175 RepID=A0A192GZA0_9LACO|nr:hypothetical protein [Loigolactobacillus backii]ANK58913.1 hypothetical protein AYR52_00710 [Loigolactobacillus backii]ANK61415.1 hypothetical protein AYR53_00765 [Loigolactobacillus backii]ANK63902.1 hypothetical protein AYR54_00700 [Loigolactobacillus backii]ANK66350.1 hypothetical protein AYR55_00705 [Loigolactobacillus backii]ANK69385.1 hypothetical protein AYR56_03950 [Loigolactobacillus backii]
MLKENEFSTDWPTLRTELTAVLPKRHVLKYALDTETIVGDLVTVVVWLGVLAWVAIMLFEGLLFGGGSGGLTDYFKVLYFIATMFVVKPIPFIWAAALVVKIGLSLRQALFRRRLLAKFQDVPATLQIGVAYSINAENAVIIRQTNLGHSFERVLETLPKEQQQQWQKITQRRIKDNFGDYKATGYDVAAIKEFIQTNFTDEFVFVAVLLQRHAKPFYWTVRQAPNAVILYFKTGKHINYVLHNFDADGAKRKGVATTMLQRLFRNKRRV